MVSLHLGSRKLHECTSQVLAESLAKIHVVILLGRLLVLGLCTQTCTSQVLAKTPAKVHVVVLLARCLDSVAIGLC